MGNDTTLSLPEIRISWGELFDKVSILELKVERIGDAKRREKVEHELNLLHTAQERAAAAPTDEVLALARKLAAVNTRLWDCEDEIRRLDHAGDFGQRFIEQAQSIYRTNDQRAALKRRIDELMGSPLVEQKWYPGEPSQRLDAGLPHQGGSGARQGYPAR